VRFCKEALGIVGAERAEYTKPDVKLKRRDFRHLYLTTYVFANRKLAVFFIYPIEFYPRFVKSESLIDIVRH
jgi:hypothetical protein